MDRDGLDIRTQSQHELQVAASCWLRERERERATNRTREGDESTQAATDGRVMWQVRMQSLQKNGETQSLS